MMDRRNIEAHISVEDRLLHHASLWIVKYGPDGEHILRNEEWQPGTEGQYEPPSFTFPADALESLSQSLLQLLGRTPLQAEVEITKEALEHERARIDRILEVTISSS